MDPFVDWLTSPIWIGFLGVALLLLVVIIAIDTRGGGPTVMKE